MTVPLTSNITDLGAMPGRRGPRADDEITAGLKAGLQLEETEGVDFPVGGLANRRGALRDRASYRRLKLLSRSAPDEQGRLVLIAQWYREEPGDLCVREQPRRRRLGRRG
jgi:hypothetical protein